MERQIQKCQNCHHLFHPWHHRTRSWKVYIRKPFRHYLHRDLVARCRRDTRHKVTSNKGANDHRSLARGLLLKWVPVKMQRCQDHRHLADFASIPWRKEDAESTTHHEAPRPVLLNYSSVQTTCKVLPGEHG